MTPLNSNLHHLAIGAIYNSYAILPPGDYPSVGDASALGLQPEQGLRVERVVPGTIAQILGLRRGDAVVELDGQPIRSSDDVKRVLAERKADQELVVSVIDGKDQRRTLRWKPSDGAKSSAGASKNEEPKTKGLRKL